MKVHHIGYAVNSIEKALAELSALGFESSGEPVDDASRNVRILLLANGPHRVELVAPLDPERTSPVDGILAKRGPGPYHICYEDSDLPGAVDRPKGLGFSLIQAPSYAPALDSDVAFLFHRELGLVELVQE